MFDFNEKSGSRTLEPFGLLLIVNSRELIDLLLIIVCSALTFVSGYFNNKYSRLLNRRNCSHNNHCRVPNSDNQPDTIEWVNKILTQISTQKNCFQPSPAKQWSAIPPMCDINCTVLNLESVRDRRNAYNQSFGGMMMDYTVFNLSECARPVQVIINISVGRKCQYN